MHGNREYTISCITLCKNTGKSIVFVVLETDAAAYRKMGRSAMGQTNKKIFIILLDCLLMAFVGGVALLTRFEYSFDEIPRTYIETWLRFLAVQMVITVCLFLRRKMYHFVWRAVSIHDVADMVLNVFAAFGISCLVGLFLGLRLPISVYFIMLVCLLILQVGMRCFLRFYVVFVRKAERSRGRERIMVIGGGEAGRILIQEMQGSRKVDGTICCIIDDNPQKWGKKLNGVPIVGGRNMIGEMVGKQGITQIFFAIPTATAAQKREILDICKMTKCKVLALPGIYQLVNGEVSVAAMKSVQVEDLLGREPVKLNIETLDAFLRDRVVLVTGGGGSIGSELCKQIARYGPKRLVIMDSYENNAYELQQELKREYGGGLDLVVQIGSIRDKQRTYDIVQRYRPEIIFHAAAHKHVPLMEDCPAEAIKNNVFGTYHVVRAAEKFGVKKFVMISTDKAVNPTNLMGATKRFCEMILQSRTESTTEFCAVRFGNVLGSNGSVVPLFKRQIEAGGPITLTDKRIIRYFMTIPEAVQLVLEAGAMAKQSQVFVLDMGEPVRILDLAENMIRLSGLEPHVDIEIKEIGLRPGEKLYEELLMNSKFLVETDNEKIFIEDQTELNPDVIMSGLIRLDVAVTEGASNEEILVLMKELVPTYRAPEEVNGEISHAGMFAQAT